MILDSGSDVSLLPRRHQRNLDETTLGCKLQNCQGGALEISGTKQAELYVQDREGQGVILQHKFIVGDVQSCIMSLGELAITKVHTAACLGLARFHGPQQHLMKSSNVLLNKSGNHNIFWDQTKIPPRDGILPR